MAVAAFVMPNAPIDPKTPLSAFVVPLEPLEAVAGGAPIMLSAAGSERDLVASRSPVRHALGPMLMHNQLTVPQLSCLLLSGDGCSESELVTYHRLCLSLRRQAVGVMTMLDSAPLTLLYDHMT
jgi:hypothetical protein